MSPSPGPVEPTFEMRRFAPGDQSAVRALVLAGLAQHWGDALDPSVNPDLDDIAASYADGVTMVAARRHRGHDVIVGTGTIVARRAASAEIVRMSVAEDRRGLGIGRALVEVLVDTAASGALGAAIDRVVLETTATWHDTIGFYERCGFVFTHYADGEFGRDAWFERRLERGGSTGATVA